MFSSSVLSVSVDSDAVDISEESAPDSGCEEELFPSQPVSSIAANKKLRLFYTIAEPSVQSFLVFPFLLVEFFDFFP